MESHFDVSFPLILEHENALTVKFFSGENNNLEFDTGIYYLCGDNGSGKTTFLNILALIAGNIGKDSKGAGTISFNNEKYNGDGFDYLMAADLREKSFCIFPQKAFFLPISTRDNYIILNGTKKNKEKTFSPEESPDLLSGGQQQKILMDIILDDKKPVWFLDEPLTNMDGENRFYFWKTMFNAYKNLPKTIFFIDHWIDRIIIRDRDFNLHATLKVSIERHGKGIPFNTETHDIKIYANRSPGDFFYRQALKSKKELNIRVRRKSGFN